MRLPKHAVECSLTHYGAALPDFKFMIQHVIDGDWVSPEEEVAAMRTRSVWVLQWYERNQVGFYIIAAHSLAALMAHVEESETTEDYT